MKPNFKPLSNRLLVKRDKEEEETPGGIILPDSAKRQSQWGTVLAVGPGKRNQDGNYVDMDVHIGDRVCFSKYAGSELEVTTHKFLVLTEEEVLVVDRSNQED